MTHVGDDVDRHIAIPRATHRRCQLLGRSYRNMSVSAAVNDQCWAVDAARIFERVDGQIGAFAGRQFLRKLFIDLFLTGLGRNGGIGTHCRLDLVAGHLRS